jgi:hypothetical protein
MIPVRHQALKIARILTLAAAVLTVPASAALAQRGGGAVHGGVAGVQHHARTNGTATFGQTNPFFGVGAVGGGFGYGGFGYGGYGFGGFGYGGYGYDGFGYGGYGYGVPYYGAATSGFADPYGVSGGSTILDTINYP